MSQRISCIVMLLGYWSVAMGLMAEPIPTPSPTCNDSWVYAQFDPPPDADPTYQPGGTVDLCLAALDESGWPTTPTTYYWSSTFHEDLFSTSTCHVWQIPDPAPDTIRLSGKAYGNGIRPDCPNWTSRTVGVTFRRFDYIPPTPTEVPTPTESPSPTPEITPLNCTEMAISPPASATGLPTDYVIIEHAGIRFLGLTWGSGQSFPTTQIGEKKFIAENLYPNEYYLWYFVGGYWPDGSDRVCFIGFGTGPMSTHTATPTETATPIPTTATPTDSPIPTDTPTPVPTGPTPTATPGPTPVAGSGWLLSRLPSSPSTRPASQGLHPRPNQRISATSGEFE